MSVSRNVPAQASCSIGAKRRPGRQISRVDLRHATVFMAVVACGGRSTPPPAPVSHLSVVLAGPTVAPDSLRVAASDSFGVRLLRDIAPGATVRVVSDRAALDFIDAGGDVLVTDRPGVMHYASSRPDVTAIPLPWDRQYVLVSSNTPPTPDVRDAVHAETRAPHAQCAGLFDGPTRPITYVAGDSIARSIAERFVGTGLAPGAIPLGHAALLQALTTDPSGWYLLTRPAGDDTCAFGALKAQPLVETRSQLIVRRGAVGIVADSSGWPRLETKP
jgi:hypothetical protein